MTDQLGLFADERFCAHMPTRAKPGAIEPCVRAPGHDGLHYVWRQTRNTLVAWEVDDEGKGKQLFHARFSGHRGALALTPAEVAAACGISEAARAEMFAAE